MWRQERTPVIHPLPRRGLRLCLPALWLLALPGAVCLAQSAGSGPDGLVAAVSHAAGTSPGAAAPGHRDLSVAAARQYRIGVDDLLTVSVWHQPDLSHSIPVRPDGMISLPLVGEVQAAGKTTPELEDELRASLAQYIRDPELTVMVAQLSFASGLHPMMLLTSRATLAFLTVCALLTALAGRPAAGTVAVLLGASVVLQSIYLWMVLRRSGGPVVGAGSVVRLPFYLGFVSQAQAGAAVGLKRNIWHRTQR